MNKKQMSHAPLQQINCLLAGKVSVDNRFKRLAKVIPQLNGRCAKRQECDSVLSATNDVNHVELHGETDDKDMDDGEMGFDDGSAQARNIRDLGQPTVKEHQKHMTTHRRCRSWCKFCVMGRGANALRIGQEIGCSRRFGRVPHVSMGSGFLGSVPCAGHP